MEGFAAARRGSLTKNYMKDYSDGIMKATVVVLCIAKSPII